jgi:hypothetical protein
VGRRVWQWRHVYRPRRLHALRKAWVYPIDFSTAVAKERTAVQMDHPSSSDSITITTSAIPAPNRWPTPCADRREASNIQFRLIESYSCDHALLFE